MSFRPLNAGRNRPTVSVHGSALGSVSVTSSRIGQPETPPFDDHAIISFTTRADSTPVRRSSSP